jgi:hypothetical protein
MVQNNNDHFIWLSELMYHHPITPSGGVTSLVNFAVDMQTETGKVASACVVYCQSQQQCMNCAFVIQNAPGCILVSPYIYIAQNHIVFQPDI